MLMKSIILLRISRRDTLKRVGMVGPFANSVRDTRYWK
jgi:hypothetical protein